MAFNKRYRSYGVPPILKRSSDKTVNIRSTHLFELNPNTLVKKLIINK